MKSVFISSILLFSAFFVEAQAAVPVRNGCSLFDRYGQLRETYHIETMRDEASQRVSAMTVERRFYYDDLVIYKKGSNELLGDKVQLPIPALDRKSTRLNSSH